MTWFKVLTEDRTSWASRRGLYDLTKVVNFLVFIIATEILRTPYGLGKLQEKKDQSKVIRESDKFNFLGSCGVCSCSCVDRTQKLDFAATASDVVSFTPRVLIHKSSSSREIWRRKVQGDYQYFNSYQEPVRCLQDKLETLQSYCKQSLLNQILRVVLCKSLQLASVACLPQIAPSSVYYCSTRSASRLTSVLSVDPNI